MKRQTKQREILNRVMLDSQEALSAQEFYELAKKQLPKLGLATIYRTINSWLEEEFIKPVCLPNNVTKYEAIKRGHRHYFQCERCEGTFGLKTCSGNFQKMLPEGFILKGHEVILYGLCSSCA